MKNKPEKSKFKLVITKTDRLSLIALMYIARQAVLKMEECDEAMSKIIGCKEKWDSLLSQEYFETTPNVDDCLKNMKIKVK